MNNDTVTFTIRRQALADFLTRMEKCNSECALFGFEYFMIDPWPSEPVMAWSLAAYSDDEDEAPCLIDSIPIIRASGGDGDDERASIISCRYGRLDMFRALWEQNTSSASLLDLTVRVREEVQRNTLAPISLKANTTLHSHP